MSYSNTLSQRSEFRGKLCHLLDRKNCNKFKESKIITTVSLIMLVFPMPLSLLLLRCILAVFYWLGVALCLEHDAWQHWRLPSAPWLHVRSTRSNSPQQCGNAVTVDSPLALTCMCACGPRTRAAQRRSAALPRRVRRQLWSPPPHTPS